jgi:hypothetical protein
VLVEPIGQVHEQQHAVVLRLSGEPGGGAADAVPDRAEAQLAERERVAQALCDTVLHDLFALGLTLQGIAMRADGDLKERLHRVVADFDDVITGVRRAVFPVAAAAAVVASGPAEVPGEGGADGETVAGPTALPHRRPVRAPSRP